MHALTSLYRFISGGKCVSTSQGYKCECLQNFAGIHCSYEINPCYNFECHNGGRCVVRRGRTKPFCECQSNFDGDHCQIPIDPCYDVTCFNGGECRLSPMGNGFICYCVSGYHGEFCEEKINLCSSLPCKNGAECKNYITSFLCICLSNFYGKLCEFEIMMSDKTKDVDTNHYNVNDVTDEINRTITIVNSTKILTYTWLNVISIVFVFVLT